MRGLIVLCLVAAAFAAPQYSYEQAGVVSAGPSGQAAGGSLGGGSLGGGGGGGGGGGLSGASSGGSGLISSAPASWNKQIYIHSAPEDDLSGDESGGSSSSSNRRNLRVVLIKAPENRGLENAALQLAKTAGEDRTAIYVLTKQADISSLQNKLSQIQDLNANKPEVHFVKYKTPQEAEHAQHTIQAQYDQLPGPSQISNEGIAPISSVIGSLGNSGGRGGANGYLPPIFRFRH